MPKKQLTDSLALDDAAPSPGLAGWQATGLALAAAAMAARAGLGALVGAVLLAPIVYALVRLRRHAPNARSTAELVGSTLGPRGTAFAGILQVTGYVLIAVTAAQFIGMVFVPQQATTDPFSPIEPNHWLWSLWAVAAIVVAAVLVFALPGRVVASLAAVLALVGLLIQFYYALAVAARAMTGTVTEQIVSHHPPPTLGVLGTLTVLAVSLFGVEVVTTRTRRGSSNGWPMSLAVGVVALIAAVTWWAAQQSGWGGNSLNGSTFGIAVGEFYGDTGATVVTVGAAMFIFAALLALLWGIAAVTEALDAQASPDTVFAGIVVAMAVLAVAVIQADWTPGYVGGLVLLALYAVVLVANSRIAADSVVSWWLRFVMPVVLAAVVLLPLLWAEFSLGALEPVLVAAVLVAAAAATALMGTRSRPD